MKFRWTCHVCGFSFIQKDDQHRRRLEHCDRLMEQEAV